MPRGGARPGAGRPKGVPNRRTRKLTEATAEAVAIAAKQGVTPLQHMMNVLHDPNATPTRKDAMAASAAPYVHCKLSATATLNVPDVNYTPPEIKIYALPRGCQVVDGRIVHPDGSEASPEETAFTPFKATPDLLPALPSSEPASAEPLPVLEAEDDPKIELLDAHRRRRDDDETSGAA